MFGLRGVSPIILLQLWQKITECPALTSQILNAFWQAPVIQLAVDPQEPEHMLFFSIYPPVIPFTGIATQPAGCAWAGWVPMVILIRGPKIASRIKLITPIPARRLNLVFLLITFLLLLY